MIYTLCLLRIGVPPSQTMLQGLGCGVAGAISVTESVALHEEPHRVRLVLDLSCTTQSLSLVVRGRPESH